MPFTLQLILIFIPVFGFLFLQRRIKTSQSIVAALYLMAVIALPLLKFGRDLYSNYRQPPEWDFLCFWSSGQVAIRGENFYDPQSFYRLSLPYEPSDRFQEVWMDVGFWYPPMTMFLFLPLGLFDISTAYLVWQFVNVLLSFACIYILWRSFLAEHGLLSLLLIAALLLMLTSSRGTFWFAQTNFVLLFLFLLFWKNRSKAWSGTFLAACAMVKPYMALLFLYPLLTRKWKLLFVAVTVMLIMIVLSIVAFGPEVFARFLSDPTPPVSDHHYTQPINQSLLATILRATGHQEGSGSPLSNPLYLGISALLVSLTGWAILRTPDARDEWVILSLLFLALLIYPATLSHYGVLLIVPMVYLLSLSNSSTPQRIAIFCIVFVTYLLSGFNNSGDYIFFANLFMWLVCISAGLGLLDRAQERTAAQSQPQF